ncbi:site-specific integrase [Methanosarcina sp. WH1]|uniref:tyrosine-type recombinase/integrase n=1 Tax=Methanosarcina sp. WH1 TaxID=1434102 RepID=UPI000615CAA1|nr:site-specific integrase [Methanosarcina sp. WH1]AKB22325.1 phage integrase [Methanosarcina sp. WH1]
MGRFSKTEYKSGQHALTAGQVKALLLSFNNLQDKAMIALAISIGLRREDLVNVKRNDYNPDTGNITYYESKKKRTRTVKIPSAETIQLLNMHIQTCRKSPWLFPSPKQTGKFANAHISSRQCYDILNEHLERTGLEARPFHSLRATCYKLAQASGWTQRQACELLGDSLRVAEIHYDAPSIGEMQALALSKPLI